MLLFITQLGLTLQINLFVFFTTGCFTCRQHQCLSMEGKFTSRSEGPMLVHLVEVRIPFLIHCISKGNMIKNIYPINWSLLP